MAEAPTLDFNEPFAGFERDNEVHLWLVRRLWELSKDLPVFEYEVASFNGFDRDVWFGSQRKPTLRNILDHYRKLEKADFLHPVILNQDGIVLDGVHRICRAHLDGRKTIPAVKFEVDPLPDRKHALI